MADVKELIERYASLSDSERNLLKKEIAAAEQAAKAEKEAAERKAEAVAKAKAKLGSDGLYDAVARDFRALQKMVEDLRAVASPAGAKAAAEVGEALGRAGGLLASSKKALALTDAEKALFPAAAPVAKNVAKRGK